MTDRELDSLFLRFRDEADVAALAEVFDRSAPELLRVARHLCREATLAEDVLQESFRTAIEKRAQFDAQQRFLPWMVGILARHDARFWLDWWAENQERVPASIRGAAIPDVALPQ